MNSTLQVELINSSNWWLPVLGSAVVAAVALVGVLVSNATNRAAITSADRREIDDWRRTKNLEAIGNLLRVSQSISGEVGDLHGKLLSTIAGYASTGNLRNHTGEFFFTEADPIVQRLRSFRTEVEILESTISVIAPNDVFVSSTELANKARELLFAEREAMRYWYLFRVNEPSDDAHDKDSWWHYEGQIVALTADVRAAHDALANVFRLSIAQESAVSFDARVDPTNRRSTNSTSSEQTEGALSSTD